MSSNARGIHESPGIYTREIDVSNYSSRSAGVTTLGLVGETLIGPAFQPIPISSYTEFKTYFGGTSPEKYKNGYPKYELSYIAKEYLKQSQQLYVSRVLGLSGYQFDGLWALHLNNTNITGDTTFALLRSKSEYIGEAPALESLVSTITGITISPSNFTGGTNANFDIIAIDRSGVNTTYNVSLNPLNKNYILKVLGSGVNGSNTSKIFVEEMYESVVSDAVSGATDGSFYGGSTVGITGVTGFDDYRSQFQYAKTPYFVSELKGNKAIPLFRLLTLSDGENANNMFKVSISNIDLGALTFELQIRAIYDTDTKPVILERYTNCTLNPRDTNYLGAQIGTSDEQFKLRSKYVVADIVDDNNVKESVPMGFEGYQIKTIPGYSLPTLAYNTSYTDTGSAFGKKSYFGIPNTVDSDYFSYKGINGTGTTKGFHLEPNSATITGGTGETIFTTLDSGVYDSYVAADKKLMKFTTYFAGGFDGWDIFRENRTNTNLYQFNQYKVLNLDNVGGDYGKLFKSFGELELGTTYGIPDVPTTTGITSDFYAFWSAARAFADPEFIDINVFATPGIDWKNNSVLTSEILDMIENERKDSLYIITTPDKETGAGDAKTDMITADQIVESLEASDIDTNFAATYYPWCQYYDAENGAYLYLPATKDVVRDIAYTDNTAYAWFPPAGLGRGNVDCIKAKKSLVLTEEDILSKGRINVIKTFALDGVKIWGQRTLQVDDTALNRIGVRRMMLYLRKEVRRSNLPLIFQPNDNTTKNNFIGIVNPILNSVKKNRGLSEFKIVIDDSVEAKARHEMNVKIWVKPIGALEFISIDFMITEEGFDFATI